LDGKKRYSSGLARKKVTDQAVAAHWAFQPLKANDILVSNAKPLRVSMNFLLSISTHVSLYGFPHRTSICGGSADPDHQA
jgi:hypothetical protein